MTGQASDPRRESWYRTVWRWHFYAGLFCLPFVLWLAITGSIYLFKPQIQAMIDAPYAGLRYDGPLHPPSARAAAAVEAVPGSILHHYVLPARPDQATQIVVGVGAEETRVYVHPQTLAVLHKVGEEQQFLRMIFLLHGELLAGRWGSALVELAASWTIIMIVTGLFLWWPRGSGPGGVLWPRLNRRGRAFWRDIHAVTGAWVSFLALFLIITGLPWAKNWGDYLRVVRSIEAPTLVKQDWATSSEEERRARARFDSSARMMMGDHAEHGGMGMAHPAASLSPLDRVAPVAASLGMAGPVEISPPTTHHGPWLVQSQASNRPLRVTVVIDGETGNILWQKDFAGRPLIDRVVGYGVALHEGAYFGFANQMLSLAAASGLIVLTVSGTISWWCRRPKGSLGAPVPEGRVRHNWALVGLVILLGVLIPLFGISLGVVALLDLLWLRRSAAAAWMGLRKAPML